MTLERMRCTKCDVPIITTMATGRNCGQCSTDIVLRHKSELVSHTVCDR